MKTLIFKFSAISAILFCVLKAQPQKPATLVQTSDFIKAIYVDNFYQVKAGNLALKKAKDGGVKAFGSQMVADYTQLEEQLRKLSPEKKYQLTEADSTDVIIGKLLTTNSGADFDRYYVSIMITRDNNMAEAYSIASKNQDDPQIREYARKNLQIIRDHLSSVTALAKRIHTQISQ